ncbi:MAG: hypothetical protein PF442_08645 [Desulfobulbaceae bacterium]|jgi:hypothetical protein|nr:hypothetical protein [Desulfobulbaceae bacterium]
MKKIAIFIFFTLVSSTFAYAEELVLDLKSGNSVIIEYTGVIESVSLIGETDAIKTMNFQKDPKKSGENITTQPNVVSSPPETTQVKDQKNGWIRMKMADPLSED